MTYDWVQFLEFASALANDATTPGPIEASLRSSISRAYYACYHSVCAYNNTQPVPYRYKITGTGVDHRGLIRHFKSSPDQVRRIVGSMLEVLLNRRTDADYRDRVSDLGDKAHLCVDDAERILTLLHRLGWSGFQ